MNINKCINLPLTSLSGNEQMSNSCLMSASKSEDKGTSLMDNDSHFEMSSDLSGRNTSWYSSISSDGGRVIISTSVTLNLKKITKLAFISLNLYLIFISLPLLCMLSFSFLVYSLFILSHTGGCVPHG